MHPMFIHQLSTETTTRLISSQSVYDASSVIKELMDNAIDAGASSIRIIISANTVDSIKVTDDGRGISCEDRPLVGLRHHTSKIRDFADLDRLGGSSLGFRGDALSSIADLSGEDIWISTRTRTEEVASRLRISGRNAVSREGTTGHPVGTTVTVTNFLETLPVRYKRAKQQANATIRKVRSLLRSYVLARLDVRFNLRWSRTAGRQQDFDYVPPKSYDLENVVRAVFGTNLSSQCLFVSWPPEGQSGSKSPEEGLAIAAVLLRPDFDQSKVSEHEQYVSIDGRPIVSVRGIGKTFLQLYRRYLAASRRKGTSAPKNPFMCIRVTCPKGYYDVNFEPSKDTVGFGSDVLVMNVFEVLLKSLYPERGLTENNHEGAMSKKQQDAKPIDQLRVLQAGPQIGGSAIHEGLLPSSEKPHAYETADVPEAGLPSPSAIPWPNARSKRDGFDSMSFPGSYGPVQGNQDSLRLTEELLPTPDQTPRAADLTRSERFAPFIPGRISTKTQGESGSAIFSYPNRTSIQTQEGPDSFWNPERLLQGRFTYQQKYATPTRPHRRLALGNIPDIRSMRTKHRGPDQEDTLAINATANTPESLQSPWSSSPIPSSVNRPFNAPFQPPSERAEGNNPAIRSNRERGRGRGRGRGIQETFPHRQSRPFGHSGEDHQSSPLPYRAPRQRGSYWNNLTQNDYRPGLLRSTVGTSLQAATPMRPSWGDRSLHDTINNPWHVQHDIRAFMSQGLRASHNAPCRQASRNAEPRPSVANKSVDAHESEEDGSPLPLCLQLQLIIDVSQSVLERAATIFSPWQNLGGEGNCRLRAFDDCSDETVASWESAVREQVRLMKGNDNELEGLDIGACLHRKGIAKNA